MVDPEMDFDACTEFWVKDFATFEEFTKSEEYKAATRKFERLDDRP
jgi:hypothetical protein